jgi:hypothetical protein
VTFNFSDGVLHLRNDSRVLAQGQVTFLVADTLNCLLRAVVCAKALPSASATPSPSASPSPSSAPPPPPDPAPPPAPGAAALPVLISKRAHALLALLLRCHPALITASSSAGTGGVFRRLGIHRLG